MESVLLIDGENFKRKMKSVFYLMEEKNRFGTNTILRVFLEKFYMV